MLALAVASVALNAVGPKILGRATDLIFAGFVGKQLPATATRDQVVAGLRAQGEDNQADLIARMDHLVPGMGIDFGAVGRVLLFVFSLYAVASLLSWAMGWILSGAVNRTIYDLRRDVEDKLNRLPLPYFDNQPRGELLSRVTNDIDNVAQSMQQTLSQMLTSLLTVVAMVAMMLYISPLLALIALVTIPISMVVTADDRQALAEALRAAVEEHRRAQRHRRGDLHRSPAGQGVRSRGRGAGHLQGQERRPVRRRLRCPVHQRHHHADDDVHREPQLRRHRRGRRPPGGQRVDEPG